MSRLFLIYMGSLAVRSVGIALIAGICCWKVRNVAVRHAVWVVVLAAMVLMPVVDSFLPVTWVPVRVQQIVSQQSETAQVVSLKSAIIPATSVQLVPVRSATPALIEPFDWWQTAAGLYMLVALAMFGRLIMGFWKIRELRRAGKPITGNVWEETVVSEQPRWRIPVLLESQAVQVPMTIGFFRPAIVLPVSWLSWDDWKLRAVLLHEMAHVRRGDWGIAAMAALTKCAYWLNPLSWFLERQLSELAEHASDDASISWARNTTRYAEILLEFAVAAQNGGRFMRRGVAMAQHKVQSRIERVLRNPNSGSGIMKVAGWILMMIVAAPVIYSAAALQVASRGALATIPTHSNVLSATSSLQVPTHQQPQQQSAQVALSQTAPGPSSQAVEVQKAYELELEKAQKDLEQRMVEAEVRKLIEEVAQKSRNRSDMAAKAGLLQEDLVTLENKMRQVEAETEMLKSRIGQSTTTQEMAQTAQAQLRMLQARQRELGERLLQAQAATARQTDSTQGTGEYRIKPGDALSVFVFNHPELSREGLTVQPDGRVSSPLVQSIPASGLTPAQLKVEIEKKLKEILDSANVTVILESK